MSSLTSKIDLDAGSRMHLLDWLETPRFLIDLRGFVAPVGFTIRDDAPRRPIGRKAYRESELIGPNEPFLSASQQSELCTWWLAHKRGAKLPTWDLVVAASDESGRPALVLVEAKAHASELSASGKPIVRRDSPDQQARSDANHEQIGRAIAEASGALCKIVPDISLSRDKSYQFANRVAFAWKLACMGVPVALIYLGFMGDLMISEAPFQTSKDWHDAVRSHTAAHFPTEMLGCRIECGNAQFWLLVRELQVLRCSPPIEARRSLGAQA